MAKSSAEYWRKRMLEQEERSQEIDSRYLEQMERELKKYQRSVIKDIEAFYGRYSVDHKVSLIEAEQYLSNNELLEFQDVTLEEFRKMVMNPHTENRLLDALAYRHRISRKEALLAEIERKTIELFGSTEGLVQYTFKNMGEVYGSAKINIARTRAELGLGVRRPLLDLKTIKQKLRVNWSGKNLSKSIWGHEEWLYDELADILEEGFSTGKSLEEITETIADKVLSGSENRQDALYNARRLVRTENAAFNSLGAIDELKANWEVRYKIIAVLDSRTSKTCRNMHGRSFDVDEFELGETAPPFHVWCRSTIEPDDEEFDYFQETDWYAGQSLDEIFEEMERDLEKVINQLGVDLG